MSDHWSPQCVTACLHLAPGLKSDNVPSLCMTLMHRQQRIFGNICTNWRTAPDFFSSCHFCRIICFRCSSHRVRSGLGSFDSPWISFIYNLISRSTCDSQQNSSVLSIWRISIFKSFQAQEINIRISYNIGNSSRPADLFAAQRSQFFLTSQKVAIH